MVRAEPSFDRSGRDVFYGQFNPGRFWHTIRGEDGKAINFATEKEALEAARVEWWSRVSPPSTRKRKWREARHESCVTR